MKEEYALKKMLNYYKEEKHLALLDDDYEYAKDCEVSIREIKRALLEIGETIDCLN